MAIRRGRPESPETSKRGGVYLTARDLWLLFYLPAMAVIAWTLPESVWEQVCGRLARVAKQLKRGGTDATRQRLARRLHSAPAAGSSDPAFPARNLRELALAEGSHHHLLHLCLLGSLRPGGWSPDAVIEGAEHLDAALQAGRGAILWVAPTLFAPLVTKAVFAQAGYPLTHLSRREHGYSKSRFGLRFLNPIWAAAENRYLIERFVIQPGDSVAALRGIARRVRENGIVSITFSGEGRRTYETEILGRSLAVPAGPIALARRSGAALLPVFTARTAPRRFTTTVHAALEVWAGEDLETAAIACIDRYARLAESHLIRYPDQLGAC